jgi:hypothetical protein
MSVEEDKAIMNNGLQAIGSYATRRGPNESIRADLRAREIQDAHTSYQTASISQGRLTLLGGHLSGYGN